MKIVKFEEIPLYDAFFVEYGNGSLNIYIKSSSLQGKCIYAKSVDELPMSSVGSFIRFTSKYNVQVFNNFKSK